MYSFYLYSQFNWLGFRSLWRNGQFSMLSDDSWFDSIYNVVYLGIDISLFHILVRIRSLLAQLVKPSLFQLFNDTAVYGGVLCRTVLFDLSLHASQWLEDFGLLHHYMLLHLARTDFVGLTITIRWEVLLVLDWTNARTALWRRFIIFKEILLHILDLLLLLKLLCFNFLDMPIDFNLLWADLPFTNSLVFCCRFLLIQLNGETIFLLPEWAYDFLHENRWFAFTLAVVFTLLRQTLALERLGSLFNHHLLSLANWACLE